MKKGWNLLLVLSMLLTMCVWTLPVGAEEPAPGTNLLAGGYGWTMNNGWGAPGGAVDGDRTKGWYQSRAVVNKGLTTGANRFNDAYIAFAMPESSGTPKFNKLVCYLDRTAGFSPDTYSLKSYKTAGNADPGFDASGNFIATPGQSIWYGAWVLEQRTAAGLAGKVDYFYQYAINLNHLNVTDANQLEGEYTIADSETNGAINGTEAEPDKVVYELETPTEGRVFNFMYSWTQKETDQKFGFKEIEAYYVTPATVKWNGETKTVIRPAAGETREVGIDDYSVYDQLGDVMSEKLKAAFTPTLELKENYPGVTLEDGKLKLTSECTADTIVLNYTAADKSGNTVCTAQELEISVESAPADYVDVLAAAEYLKTVIPAQATQDITLPTSYTGTGNVSISWATDNENYITSGGKVTRPSSAAGNVAVKLTATITCGEETITREYTVTVTAEEEKPAPGTNLLAGGYGWTMDLGWGYPGGAVDGDMKTSWNQSRDVVNKGLTTGANRFNDAYIAFAMPKTSGTPKFNKLILHLDREAGFSPDTYSLKSYKTAGNADPGFDASGNFIATPGQSVGYKDWCKAQREAAGLTGQVAYFYQYAINLNGLNVANANQLEGEYTIAVSTAENPVPMNGSEAEPDKVVYELETPTEGRVFNFMYSWEKKEAKKKFGFYEIEAYYVTPADVKWNSETKTVTKPAAGKTEEVSIDDYSVYDQSGDVMGEKLLQAFPGTLKLKENYPGVTLEDGKLKITSDCTTDTIVLTYTAADKSDNTVCLTQELEISVEAVSNDYNDVMEAAEYLKTVIPETATQDITLPASYAGTNTVTISWETANENYITSGGKVTRPNGAVGDVAVKLTATITCGEETITRDYTVTVTAMEPIGEEKQLKEAKEALKWEVISGGQEQTAVGKALMLPRVQNGALVIGGKSYEGVNISWSSSNPAVLSDKGNVTRQETAASLTLTATLSVTSGGQKHTLDVPFDITVAAAGTAVSTKNIMKGGYGWCTGGWGNATLAIDGNRNSAWALGNHSANAGAFTAAVKTASGRIEKYNTIKMHFFMLEHLTGYDVTGYDTMSNDPGGSANVGFIEGGGAKPVAAYNAEDPSTHWDENGTLSVSLKEAKQSRYFGLTVNYIKDAAGGSSTGIYEFEVYYVTPNEVRWNDEAVTVYKPRAAGETISVDIPKYTVCDEFGDELIDKSFTEKWALAENYAGVTLENDKLVLTSACDAKEIDLIYTSGDNEKTWLQQTMTISVAEATEDYYTMMGVVDYLDTQIPERAANNLNMLTSKDGVTVVWTSDDEASIALDGTVTRPAYGTADKTVTLTAEFSIGAYQFQKTYVVDVIQNATDEQMALMDANRIDLGIKGVVSSNITLPAKGYYGSAITWSSNKPNVISAEGVYTRTDSSGDSTPVTLTATVTYNGKTVQKEITLYAATSSSGGSGNGNTGGGGGRGNGGRGSSSGNGISGVDTPNIAPPPLTNEQLEQGVFADVPSGHWAKSYIEELAGRKIISGVDGSHYEPGRSITREEFLKLIITAFGVTVKPDGVAFSDVASGAWYADYVATAYQEGFINGISETEFGIGRSITRQDAVVILERVLTKLGTEYTGDRKEYADDSTIADYAAKAIENLSAIGIVQGDEEGNFLPQNHTTRAEAAKIICTAMKQGGLWK